jgi:hypothetical protein
MKRVRLLFMGREQNPFEDVPALYELSMGRSVSGSMGRSVSGKKWKCDFLYPLTLLIAWFECRETVSAAPPDALN